MVFLPQIYGLFTANIDREKTVVADSPICGRVGPDWSLACLNSVLWASKRKWSNIAIFTYCLNLVVALKDLEQAHHTIQTIIFDIIYFASTYFTTVSFVKSVGLK